MTTQLRNIAVHVSEPELGRFVWVLTELADDRSWSEVRRAEAGATTYKQAMADGLLALQSMVTDLDIGPRAEKQTRRSPKLKLIADGQAELDGSNESQTPSQTKRSVFGFGLAN